MGRSERLKTYPEQAFPPSQLDIVDHSHAHAGYRHGGGSHLSVTIGSSHFEGRSPVERHRMIYRAVNSMMPQDIHALSIKAFSPAESAG